MKPVGAPAAGNKLSVAVPFDPLTQIGLTLKADKAPGVVASKVYFSESLQP